MNSQNSGEKFCFEVLDALMGVACRFLFASCHMTHGTFGKCCNYALQLLSQAASLGIWQLERLELEDGLVNGWLNGFLICFNIFKMNNKNGTKMLK